MRPSVSFAIAVSVCLEKGYLIWIHFRKSVLSFLFRPPELHHDRKSQTWRFLIHQDSAFPIVAAGDCLITLREREWITWILKRWWLYQLRAHLYFLKMSLVDSHCVMMSVMWHFHCSISSALPISLSHCPDLSPPSLSTALVLTQCPSYSHVIFAYVHKRCSTYNGKPCRGKLGYITCIGGGWV